MTSQFYFSSNNKFNPYQPKYQPREVSRLASDLRELHISSQESLESMTSRESVHSYEERPKTGKMLPNLLRTKRHLASTHSYDMEESLTSSPSSEEVFEMEALSEASSPKERRNRNFYPMATAPLSSIINYKSCSRVNRNDSGTVHSRSNSISPTDDNIYYVKGTGPSVVSESFLRSRPTTSSFNQFSHHIDFTLHPITPKHIERLEKAYKIYCKSHSDVDKYFFSSIKQMITHLLNIYRIINSAGEMGDSLYEMQTECDAQIRSLTEHLILASQKKSETSSMKSFICPTPVSRTSRMSVRVETEKIPVSHSILNYSSYSRTPKDLSAKMQTNLSRPLNHDIPNNSRVFCQSPTSFLSNQSANQTETRAFHHRRPSHDTFVDPNTCIPDNQYKEWLSSRNIHPTASGSEQSVYPHKLRMSRSFVNGSALYQYQEYSIRHDLRSRPQTSNCVNIPRRLNI